MNSKLKKTIILHIPYCFIGLFATKLGQMWRYTDGTELGERILNLGEGFFAAMESPLPSFHLFDLCVGIAVTVIFRLIVYGKSQNAKKYRKNEEYGSARWGKPEDIAPYIDSDFRNNVILTQTERLTMNNRPKDPKMARNKNVLIVGGSGSGKTRFFIKPQIMQCHSSYCITDPKGSLVCECGKMLQRNGYRIKILNTINFAKSMHYNPMAYIHSEKDILKLVTCLIANTKSEGKANDDFWVKAETLLYTALIGYIHYEAP
ncbi:MAG: type IV secretory system conjugative DNA transfer family protein, partial [Clostridia bacterium]|nr:type IV secretory system conjugative DNA transfer family protein [Clostridia bacterium]